MWKLPAEVEEVANELRERARNPPLLGKRRTVAIVEQLRETRQPSVIPAIASALFSSKQDVHAASASAIDSLLPLVSSMDLLRLNESLGGYGWGYVSERWDGLQPEEVERYLRHPGDLSLGSLLSFHKNGYVRHEAVRYLSKMTTGREIRFLLIRQNDWVDSIFDDVQKAVFRKLTSNHLRHFANETELLFHLLKCQRRDLRGSVSKYLDLLVEPEHRDVLKDSIGQVDSKAGRVFVHHLLQRDGAHLPDTVRAGVISSDPGSRVSSLKRAFDCLDENECEVLAEKRLSDKFIPVRQIAYEMKARLSPSPMAVWQECLFDKSRSLRESAIFYLRKSNRDVASMYRKKLLESPSSFPALSGLASCGDPSDLEVFSKYLKSAFSSRRSEAVLGIGRVGDEEAVLGIQRMLCDRSARVVRAAFKQLRPKVKSLDSDDLFGLIEVCESQAGVDGILRLLMEKGRWDSLAYLIRGAAKPTTFLSCCAERSIDYVFSQNRVFTQPSHEQRQQIQNAIDESESSMRDEFCGTVSSYLSSFGFTFSDFSDFSV